MARIGKLSVILGLDSTGFLSGLKKSGQQVGALERSIASMGAAAQLWIAQTAVKAITDFARGIGESIKEVDELAKRIRLLGVDSVAYQGLAYSAKLAGIDDSMLAMGVQRFNRRIGQPGEAPSAEGIAGLQALGLDPQVIKGIKDTETQLLLVADAFATIKDEQLKTWAAQKLFDSEAVRMKDFLGQGAAKIIEQAAEAERSGATYSEKDLADAEKAADAMEKAAAIAKTQKNKLATKVGATAANEGLLLSKWREGGWTLRAMAKAAAGDPFGGLQDLVRMRSGPLGAKGAEISRLGAAAAANRERAQAAAQYGAINQAAAAQVQEDRRIQEMQLEEQRLLRQRFEDLQGITRPPVPAMDRQVEVLNMGDAP